MFFPLLCNNSVEMNSECMSCNVLREASPEKIPICFIQRSDNKYIKKYQPSLWLPASGNGWTVQFSPFGSGRIRETFPIVLQKLY